MISNTVNVVQIWKPPCTLCAATSSIYQHYIKYCLFSDSGPATIQCTCIVCHLGSKGEYQCRVQPTHISCLSHSLALLTLTLTLTLTHSHPHPHPHSFSLTLTLTLTHPHPHSHPSPNSHPNSHFNYCPS